MLQYKPSSNPMQIKVVPDNIVGLFKKTQMEWIQKYCIGKKGVTLNATRVLWTITFDSPETQKAFLKTFSEDLKKI